MDTAINFKRVSIVGTGAIGCSIASLLRGSGLAQEIVGVDSVSDHLEMAKRLGFIDRGLDDPARGVMGADAVVLALPLDEIFVVIKRAGPDLKPGALLTCVAGTTNKMLKQIVKDVPTAKNLVPSFPLTYSQVRGPGGSSPGLLLKKKCLVATNDLVSKEEVVKVSGFWKALGLESEIVDSDRFEWIVAGCHYFPMLLISLVDKLTKSNNWKESGTVLERFSSVTANHGQFNRSFQLYAKKMTILIQSLQQELESHRRSLGGLITGEQDSENKDSDSK